MNNFNDISRELQDCIRCGNCRKVCPVFNKIGTEAAAPRGKVQLVRANNDGLIPLDDELLELLSYCLSCKLCSQNCPSGVETDFLLEMIRAQAVSEKGLPLLKKIIFRFLLKHKNRWEKAAKVAPVLGKLAFKSTENGTGILPRFGFGLDKRRLLAPIVGTPLRESLPNHLWPSGKPVLKVGFFTGCMLNYIFHRDGEAVVQSILTAGCEVIIPQQQHCCGTPLRVHGDYNTAKELAIHNVKVFAELNIDRIVVACASCGLSLKKEFVRLLADDSTYGQLAEEVSRKVIDYSQLMVELKQSKMKGGMLGMKLTYHDPCHLRRGQGVWQEPRQLIQLTTDNFQEMVGAEICCGGAGSFTLQHYDLSKLIGQDKAAAIKNIGAQGVVTSCPACKLHLQDSLYQNNVKVPVYHLAELFTSP